MVLFAAALVLVSAVFAAARVAGVKNNIYKALAHVWVGFLFALAVWSPLPELGWGLFIGLCTIEVASAIYFRVLAPRLS